MKLRPSILIIGAALLICAVILNVVLPQKAAKLPKGIDSPIIAFEFANSEQEIKMLYDFELKAEREAYIDGMQEGNYLDYAYMLLYTGFIVSLIFWTAQKFRIKKFEWLTAISLLALIADAIENVYLLKINSAMEVNSQFTQYISPLHIITWIKWFSLALIFAALGIVWLRSKYGWIFINWIFLTPVLLAFASLVYKPYITSAFTYSIVLSFLLAYINICFNKLRLKIDIEELKRS